MSQEQGSGQLDGLSDAVSQAESTLASEQSEAQASGVEGEESEGVESEEGEGEEAIEEVKEEIKEMKDLKKKLKLKVNGKEVEEEVDLSDDEGLTKRFQKARAFDEKAQELAQLKKEVSDLVSSLRQDPTAVLAQLGFDMNDIAYKHLSKQVEDAKKSPEQKEREKLQAELEKERKQREEYENRIKTAEQERMREAEASKIQSDILSALQESNSIISADDPDVLYEIARAMSDAMSLAVSNPAEYGHLAKVQAKDVIPLVEEKFLARTQRRIESLVSQGKFKEVEKIVGKKNTEALRKARLSGKKVPQAVKQSIKETGLSSKDVGSPAPNKIPMRDFFKKLGQ